MLASWRRRLPAIAVGLPIVFVVSWVLFFATGTSSGSAVSEPGEFVITLLDGVTFAGLMFVVASGFTLIFGLMRTVNMAHGSLFLLAAYIAIELQQKMAGKSRNLEPADVSVAVLGRADAGRCRRRGDPRRRHPAGVPPVEPGSGPPSGADHGGDRGDHGRSDAGAVRWPRPADDLAGRRHALRRDLRPALRDQSLVHARGRTRSSVPCCGCG